MCGGRGHYCTVNGKKCLTLLLGNKIPIDELRQTKYPGNIKFPDFNNRNSSASSSDNASAVIKNRMYNRKSPGRARPFIRKKKVNVVDDADDREENLDQPENEPDEHDEDETDITNALTSMVVDYGNISIPEIGGVNGRIHD